MRLKCHSSFKYHVKTVANVATLENNLILSEFTFLCKLDCGPDKVVTFAVFQEFNFFDNFSKSFDENLTFQVIWKFR